MGCALTTDVGKFHGHEVFPKDITSLRVQTFRRNVSIHYDNGNGDMTIQVISHPLENVIGFKIEAKIEAQDIDYIAKLIENKLEKEDKLRIYAEVNDWSGMSLEAFIKDLKFALKHFNDIEKEVIVSDTKWLKRLAAITDRLFSSIEVKHFSFEEKDRAWEFIGS